MKRIVYDAIRNAVPIFNSAMALLLNAKDADVTSVIV